jgi:broad specificity phosphatase PhoE
LEDSIRYLHRGGEIAIVDGTNSSLDRRDLIRERVKKEDGYELFWIESACEFYTSSNEGVREDFCRNLKKSPDFVSLSDFEKRVLHYRQTYTPLGLDEGSFIRIHDNFSHYTLHQTQGFLPSKIVSFVVNLKQSFRAVHLARHGESTFNSRGLIGGDAPLSQKGCKFARALADYVATPAFETTSSSSSSSSSSLPRKRTAKKELHVWTSCLRRTKETANFLVRDHEAKQIEWRALNDIEVGICDGLSYEQVRNRFPDVYRSRTADKLSYRYPRGESYMDVITRLEPVIFELERGEEDLIIISHQAVLRCLYVICSGVFFSSLLCDVFSLIHLFLPACIL